MECLAEKFPRFFPEPKASVELVFLERSQTHVHCYCVDLHVCVNTHLNSWSHTSADSQQQLSGCHRDSHCSTATWIYQRLLELLLQSRDPVPLLEPRYTSVTPGGGQQPNAELVLLSRTRWSPAVTRSTWPPAAWCLLTWPPSPRTSTSSCSHTMTQKVKRKFWIPRVQPLSLNLCVNVLPSWCLTKNSPELDSGWSSWNEFLQRFRLFCSTLTCCSSQQSWYQPPRSRRRCRRARSAPWRLTGGWSGSSVTPSSWRAGASSRRRAIWSARGRRARSTPRESDAQTKPLFLNVCVDRQQFVMMPMWVGRLHITNEVIDCVEILQFNRCSFPTSWSDCN